MPTVRATVYVVEPTGYDTFENSDKSQWRVYVVDGGSEYGWAVRRGHMASDYVLTRKGEWKFDSSRYRRHRRYPLDEALALAEAHVDHLRLMGLTAQQASDHIAARRNEQSA